MTKAYAADWATEDNIEEIKPFTKFFRLFRLLRVVCFVAILCMAVFFFVYKRY